MDALDHDIIVRHLKEQGSSETQIREILSKLREYDSDVVKQSIYDSIATGSFDLNSLVQELAAQQAAREAKDNEEK